MMKCIVCGEEINESRAGIIDRLVIGISDIFLPPQIVEPRAYHFGCEEKALKIIHEQDNERYKQMGIIQ